VGRLIYLLTISLLVVIGLVAVAIVLTQTGPELRVTEGDVTVAVRHTLDRRTIVVSAGGERVSTDVIAEWGPDLRTNVYRTPSGSLAIIDFDGSWQVLRDPLKLESTSARNDWQYLGTLFMHGFHPGSEVPECMDILMSGEPPPPDDRRGWAYRNNCDAPVD
jgi:hypothetical protein